MNLIELLSCNFIMCLVVCLYDVPKNASVLTKLKIPVDICCLLYIYITQCQCVIINKAKVGHNHFSKRKIWHLCSCLDLHLHYMPSVIAKTSVCVCVCTVENGTDAHRGDSGVTECTQCEGSGVS